MAKHLRYEREDRPVVRITVRLDRGAAHAAITAPPKYRAFVEDTIMVIEVIDTDGSLKHREVQDNHA